jgi:hypothetical protein
VSNLHRGNDIGKLHGRKDISEFHGRINMGQLHQRKVILVRKIVVGYTGEHIVGIGKILNLVVVKMCF